jgi:hypothetical protein
MPQKKVSCFDPFTFEKNTASNFMLSLDGALALGQHRQNANTPS